MSFLGSWVIDSGATNHMTHSLQMFSTYSLCPSFSRPFNDWEVEEVERFLSTIQGKRLNADVERDEE